MWVTEVKKWRVCEELTDVKSKNRVSKVILSIVILVIVEDFTVKVIHKKSSIEWLRETVTIKERAELWDLKEPWILWLKRLRTLYSVKIVTKKKIRDQEKSEEKENV